MPKLSKYHPIRRPTPVLARLVRRKPKKSKQSDRIDKIKYHARILGNEIKKLLKPKGKK